MYADAHNNLGIALSEMGRFDEAMASYTRCLEQRPNHVDAHMNRALTWLRKGDYAQGWAEYEWRWKKRNLTNRPLIQPQWNGFPLDGRTILLITEQGFGDVMQFIRYAPILKSAGGARGLRVPGEADQAGEPAAPGVDVLIPQGGPLPRYDVYAPLVDRRRPGRHVAAKTSRTRCRTSCPTRALSKSGARSFPAIVSSRSASTGRATRSTRAISTARFRSKFFEPLARVPGVRLFSLQKNDGVEQLAADRRQIRGDRAGQPARRATPGRSWTRRR